MKEEKDFSKFSTDRLVLYLIPAVIVGVLLGLLLGVYNA